MGYYVRLKKSDFRINREYITDCLVNVLQARGSYQTPEMTKQIKHYKHLPDDLKLAEVVYLTWGWQFVFDEEGNVNKVEFDPQKLSEDTLFFEAIAPYVKDDSYLEMMGEDGKSWRYLFKDNQVKKVYPKIIWE